MRMSPTLVLLTLYLHPLPHLRPTLLPHAPSSLPPTPSPSYPSRPSPARSHPATTLTPSPHLAAMGLAGYSGSGLSAPSGRPIPQHTRQVPLSRGAFHPATRQWALHHNRTSPARVRLLPPTGTLCRLTQPKQWNGHRATTLFHVRSPHAHDR